VSSPWSFGFIVGALALTSSVLTFLLTRPVVQFLRKLGIVDKPGDRRSHVVPTPRGGGASVVAVVLVGWITLGVWMGWPYYQVLAFASAFLLLVGVSALDDLGDVSSAVRLASQFLAVALGLIALRSAGAIFQGAFGLWLDATLAAIGWVWLVNIFNFMDGTDGMTVVETVCVTVGVVAIAFFADLPASIAYLAAVVAGALVGFAPFNWYPAKVFLGDVGAIPVGYVVGWLLIMMAMTGHWSEALILPLYYLADASLTLMRRLLRGEKPWRPHREHFYQLATPPGTSHARTSLMVLLVDCGLVVLAIASIWIWAPLTLAAAALLVGLLLFSFQKRSKGTLRQGSG
jgi:UDP-N-acetylmuramyl pentapeptide phosphotransferase/UDP-N-acetylglucosamine-1-phosphate transferase